MSSMEPDAQEFLKRVVWSVTLVLVYLLVLLVAGIYGNWFFFGDAPTAGNYIFYAWVIFSSITMVRLLLRWWKRRFPHG